MRLQSESGASLLSVMMAVVVVVISVAGAAAGMKQLIFARRSAASSSAANEIGAGVAAWAQETFQNYVLGSCSNPALLNPPLGPFDLGVGKLTWTRAVTLPPQFGHLTYPAEATAAVARCGTTPALRSSGTATKAFLYDCYVFSQPIAAVKAAAGKDTFVGSKYAFVEVYAQVRDFQTDQPLSCAAAGVGTPGRGLSVYYALHWVTTTSDGYLYKTRVGVSDAAF